jgi:hypothetical protein
MSEWGGRLQKLIKTINFQCPPIFVLEAKKLSKKLVFREFGGLELTMMKANNSNNNDSNREVVGILVYMECISRWDEGCSR